MNSDFEILWREWTAEHSFDSSRWRRITEGLSRSAKAGQVKSRSLNTHINLPVLQKALPARHLDWRTTQRSDPDIPIRWIGGQSEEGISEDPPFEQRSGDGNDFLPQVSESDAPASTPPRVCGRTGFVALDVGAWADMDTSGSPTSTAPNGVVVSASLHTGDGSCGGVPLPVPTSPVDSLTVAQHPHQHPYQGRGGGPRRPTTRMLCTSVSGQDGGSSDSDSDVDENECKKTPTKPVVTAGAGLFWVEKDHTEARIGRREVNLIEASHGL